MYHTFSILFYLQRNKATIDGKAPIYVRVTVNGKRSQISVNRKIKVEKWNGKMGKVIGTSAETKELNHYLDTIKNRIYKIQEKLQEQNKPITSLRIKNIFLGNDENKKYILKIFSDHNTQAEKLVGKEFAPGTVERYKTAKKHVEDFIKLEYKVEDIPVKEIDYKFISGFEYYLKTVRNCSHNTAIKYITNFKKIIRIAYANDWISKDPFFNWKSRLKIVEREFLSEEEIQTILEKEFKMPRLDQVKDIFIFSCFTGLAYADVKKLSQNDIVMGIDGELWIKTKRTKTDTRSNIPILPTAQAIIDKYAKNPLVIKNNVLLPVLSNQKMNAYLKEIADLCGITKNLTFHLARHTFATTVTLTNGVPIESVSKMLGHKSLRTTQHYAKILDRKVSQDMAALRNILSKKQQNLQNDLNQAH
jgi:site-specific recombinase XerD